MKVFIPSRNLILVTTIFLVYIVPLRAQDSPQDYLDAHNKARATVGVGPLTWDLKVALHASTHANLLRLVCDVTYPRLRNGDADNRYGQNLVWSSGNISAAEAVEKWMEEKAYYDYNSNTCAPNKLCFNYLQVVWRNSVKLGCAKVKCLINGGGTFIYCNYDPPGNIRPQKPY